MVRFLLLMFFAFLLQSCKKDINYSNNQIEDIENLDFDVSDMEINNDEDVELYRKITGDYPDGTYCAEIEYYNPKTGTRRTYNLDVEVENGDLSLIHWNNGGWLDGSHFSPQNISSGKVDFTSDRGYRYTISLASYGGGCYSGASGLRRTIENDIEEEENSSYREEEKRRSYQEEEEEKRRSYQEEEE